MDIYEKFIEQLWTANRLALKNQILKRGIPRWLQVKINKAKQRMCLSSDFIITPQMLLNNDMLLSLFMKDPKKQNIYEKIFYQQLKQIKLDVKKLPARGKQACYLIHDKIITNQDSKPFSEIKSLDFMITYQNQVVYIVNKYTNENGGAQDNQFNDVINQIKNLGVHTTHCVWFCLDGKYYTPNKIKILKQINPNAHITTLEELLQTLNNTAL